VIPSTVELIEIQCYVSPAPAQRNKIEDWYKDISVQEKADADEFIKNMRKTLEWKMPNYRPALKGYAKLGELRWNSSNKKHRLIGFFKDGKFIAVMGCYHKQNIYVPADALDEADRRRKRIIGGETGTVKYDL